MSKTVRIVEAANGRAFHLSAAQFAEYDAARHDGFIATPCTRATRRRGRESVEAFRNWCETMNWPMLWVYKSAKYARITCDGDTTGYPNTCILGDEDSAKVRLIFRTYWGARDSECVSGDINFCMWGIPNADAAKVARLLWALIRPHLVSAVERDRLMRQWWTGGNADD